MRRNATAVVEIDPFFVRDGNTYSSGGISAGIDLALSLIEEDHGRDFALKIARYLVLFPQRSGGQAQFSTHLRTQFSSVPAIQKVQQWCIENPTEDLRVATLARRAAMSERSLGGSPVEYREKFRVQLLLPETERSGLVR